MLMSLVLCSHEVNIVDVFRPLDHQGRTTGEAYVVCRDAKV